MKTNILTIADWFELDPKIVAEIYREGFQRSGQARERDENIKEIRDEINSHIYK